jgi:hypothetical protein
MLRQFGVNIVEKDQDNEYSHRDIPWVVCVTSNKFRKQNY